MATVNLYDNVAQFSASVIQTIFITIMENINAQLKSFIMLEVTSLCKKIVNCSTRSQGAEFLSPKHETKQGAPPASLPRRRKSGCEAAMTYGWRSHLAFNDDGRGTAVAAGSLVQVLNLIVSATTQEEAGDDQAIKPSAQTEKAGRTGEHAGSEGAKASKPPPVHLLRNISWIASMTALIAGAEAIHTRRISCLVMRAEARC